jgi:NAD+ kinase
MTSEAPAFGIPTTAAIEPDRLADAIERAGGRVQMVEDDGVADATDLEVLVAVGHSGLATVADRGTRTPVLPVDLGPGVPSVAFDDLEDAARTVVAGDVRTEPARLLDVAVEGSRVATVYREATMLTEAPAHISEYAIEHDAVGPIDVVRADGLVVATPAGSRGYAAAGDGPLCFPGTGLTIVPVAPFRTDRDRWVVPSDRVTARVQRDEATVVVEGDGEPLVTVERGDAVTFTPAGELAVLVVDASERGGR